MSTITLIFVLLAIIYFTKRKLKFNFFDPIGIIIILNFLVPFVAYPLLKILTFTSETSRNYFLQEMYYPTIIFIVVYIFWILGYSFLPKKGSVVPKLNYKKRDRKFAISLYLVGIVLFFLVFIYSGVDFLSSYANPLATRFALMQKTGAYHLRSLSLMLIWTGWFLNLALHFQGYKTNKVLLLISFIFVIVIIIPLGQRFQLILPILLLLLLLLHYKKISRKVIYISGILIVILIPILAIYRELGLSKQGFSLSRLIENIEKLIDRREDFIAVITERFENGRWFSKFIKIRDDIDYSIIDSIKGLLSTFLPKVFLGGTKGSDIEGILTLKIIGSKDFGTFSFTSFPEWYLTMGYFGFAFFGFISGYINKVLVGFISKMGDNIFYFALFAGGVFLKFPFLNINSFRNVYFVLDILFAGLILLFYKIYIHGDLSARSSVNKYSQLDN